MTKKNILVTGGCGFVGRHLVKRLSKDPLNSITIIDDLSTGLKLEDWPEHLKCDVEKIIYDDCINVFESLTKKFDVVFHLAAIVEGRMTIEHNPLKIAKDLMIDAALFRWAVKTRPAKIVYFSSSAVYPIELQTREHNIPLREDLIDIKSGRIGIPDMSYGWSKLTGEFLSYLAVTKHGLKVAVYRPFSGYGEDQALTYPVPAIIKRVIDSNGEPIEVWGSGEQSRDFIYIEDCISGILDTYEKINDGSALNLGSGEKTTFSELISLVCKILGKKANIKPRLDMPEGVFARYCDREKQNTFGLQLKYSLEDGIKIVADFLQHKYNKTS
jgi:GDP-L-fucose synthase